MNQYSSTESSVTSLVGADPISRRAYEIWEKEGRPEGCDLRHWLQAERELAAVQPDNSVGSAITSAPPVTGSDVRPLQGTRAAAAANREGKRRSNSPFNGEKNGSANTTGQPAARRKSVQSPPL